MYMYIAIGLLIIYLPEIDVYQKAKEKAKATEERQKTAVVGDIHPLMEALPSLELE